MFNLLKRWFLPVKLNSVNSPKDMKKNFQLGIQTALSCTDIVPYFIIARWFKVCLLDRKPEGGGWGEEFRRLSEPTSRAASQSAEGGYCGKQHKRGMGRIHFSSPEVVDGSSI